MFIFTDHSGPGRGVGLLCVCVCVSVCPDNNVWTKWPLNIWPAGSSWHYLQ